MSEMIETLERAHSQERAAQRLLRVGALLFLLALLVGLAVPRFAVPRLGLSTHLLGLMQGTFLLVSGLLWPKLKLTGAVSRAGSYLAIYGCIAAWTANLLGALWGAGNSMLPIAAGQARGSLIQERIIAAGLVTAAVSLIATAMIILWGLRGSMIGHPRLDRS
jgi:hydroxylaminobenzene mutase